MAYLLGIDAGGGGGRCLLFEPDSGRILSAGRHWQHPPARETGGLGADLDLDRIWAKIGEAAHEVMERAGAGPGDVAAIAVTSMRLATVILDGKGQPILAVPNRDGRASIEALELAHRQGEAVYERTGHWPAPMHVLPRLLWLRERDPEALASAACVLALNEWLAARLCGERAAEASQAAESLLFDVRRRTWAADWAREHGLPEAALPPLVEAGKVLGRLLPDAARHLGLAGGTPVAAGGADTQCGLLGAGVARSGRAGVVLGTTVPVQVTVDQPLLDPQRRLWTGCHVVPGIWTVESNGNGGGEALEWIAGALFPEARSAVLRFLGEAALADAGACGIVSTVGVEIMNAREIRLPVGGLFLSHMAAASDPARRRLLARAVVEGLAFSVRENLAQAERVAGASAGPVGAGGGLTRSPLLPRLLADVLGRTLVTAPHPDASALGAALCAGVGAGVYGDLAAAADAVARQARRIEPHEERHRDYARVASRWRKVHDAALPATGAAGEALLPVVLESARADSAGLRPLLRPAIVATADLHGEGLEELRELGELRYRSFREAMRVLSGPALVEELRGAHVFITEVDLVGAEVLEQCPDLRVVVSCRGKAVNVDVEACSAFGIPVLHAPGRNAEAVADLTVAFLLMLARRLPRAAAFLREGEIRAGDMARMGQAFRDLRGHELGGCTVGLVGFGAVARAVTRRLLPFGCQVLATDPFVPEERIAAAGARAVSLDALLRGSDFVSLHAAAGEGGAPLVGREEIGQMKPGAFLVNTARAALVDEAALLEALQNGRLAGAAVDVFAVEPPGSDHPLLACENVIATPHVGGNTFEVSAHQARIVAGDLRRLLCGERPRHVLNPETLDHFSWTAPRPSPPAAVRARLGQRPPSVSDLAPPAPAPAAASTPGLAPKTVAHLRKLLEAFARALESSPALRQAAQGQAVRLRFELPDAAATLLLELGDGRVRASSSPQSQEADVHLRMPAAVFDGMFTGTIDPMQAAMDGRLSFTGDAAKAMALQELNEPLSRAWQQARSEVGPPGDLTAPPPAAAAGPVSPEDVRHLIVEVVNELYGQGLITATGGNVSARVDGREDEIWITPSQMFKGQLRPEMLVRVDLEGRPLDSSGPSPSSERLMHCAVYRARPEAHAVIHAHAPNATILANSGLPFLPISTEAAFFGDIPRLPFIMPGTQELADAVGAAMRASWAVFLQNHGLLVAGRSLRRAADMVEVVERSCQIILGCHAVGREPPVLPPEVVARLQRMGDLMA